MAAVESGRDCVSILVLNAGSSSLKFGLFQDDGGEPQALLEGVGQEIGHPEASLLIDGEKQAASLPDHQAALSAAMHALQDAEMPDPVCIAHRFVHGGPELTEHLLFTPELSEKLEAAAAFAPLHVPVALGVLKTAQEKWPQARQVLCFDTAFHRAMPDVSRTLALPAQVREAGVHRYGFHGLSLESIVKQLRPVPTRLVIAHLGNGCSITAVQDGRSVDTSMGFTPNAGVLMGTRCGDIDPGVVIHLMERGHETPEHLDRLLNTQSGLLGVSGMSSDVRALSEARSHNGAADLALRMLCYQVRKAISAMAAALGGMDLLVFAGGIGENAADLRDDIVAGLAFLQPFEARVVAAREDAQMAAIAFKLLAISGLN